MRFVPWLLPVAAIAAGLNSLDVRAGTIALYGGYFLLCVVLPGVLLMRALCGSTGSWPEDIGIGAAVGFAYELAGWALFTATGQQRYLMAWPALVLVMFVTVRPLHRHWRIGRPPRVPVAWHWCVALVITLAVFLGLYYGPASSGMPPNGVAYYPDLLYNLSLVNAAVRSVPPELPQVAGHPLDYHWFANAHMAAAVDITGIPAQTVLFRLWILPVYIVSLLVFAALGRQVSGVWWSGVVSVALLAGGQFVDLWSFPAGLATSALTYYSPSLVFGTLATAAVAVFLIELLYRHPSPRQGWILVVPLLIVTGGAKPTGLPLLLGGLGLAGLCQLASRRMPWRSIATGLLVGVTILVTLHTVAGSTAGSRFGLLGIARGIPGYREATGDLSLPGSDDWTLPSLTSGDNVALWGALIIVATLLVSQMSMLSGLVVLGRGRVRRDPVAWFLGGAVIAALMALLVVDHPSAGEIYFARTALPFAAAGSAWVVTSALHGRSRWVHGAVILGGLGAGIGLVAIAAQQRPNPLGSRENRIAALGLPMLVLVACCLAMVLIWCVLRWPVRPLRGLGAGVAVLVLLGLAIPSAWSTFTNAVEMGRLRVRPAVGPAAIADQVHPDEQRAALWLRDHSQLDDIVASNTACHPARRQPPCDARGYIVSGIAGRRSVLEGWAYTQQALAQQGVDGKSYRYQPSPWPDRAGLLDRVFTAPTRAEVELLRTKFGVRWLYADLLAGPVAANTLGELAVLRHEEPSVLIYELLPLDRLPNAPDR
jgi:hypothetical protein